MSFIFPRTVRVKSPHNVLARRYHRVDAVAYLPGREVWVLLLKNGSQVHVPTDHILHFGRLVTFL
jgi:hypothetical protein